MGLVIPTHTDYVTSANTIKQFFDSERVEYCMYGSFLIPQKLRPGLSDIDIFTINETDSLLFPIRIQGVFAKIKREIDKIGIPLQINWTTTAQLKSQFFSPDENYLYEVRKGLSSPYVSQKFNSHINEINTRNGAQDDKNMARYFYRKINGIGLTLEEIVQILDKEEQDLTEDDQRRLGNLWNGIKKMVSLMGVSMRISTNESYFSNTDRELIKYFQGHFNIPEIKSEEYIKILESIKNIHDWYIFLQQGGIGKIKEMYNQVFVPFIGALSEL